MDSVLAAKWLAVIVLGIGSMSIGLLPPIFASRFQRARSSSGYRSFLSCLLCLGAGILFGTSIVHITREARPVLSVIDVGIPLTEALLGAGFLFVYCVEEVVHLALHCCSRTARCESNPRERHVPKVVRYSVSHGDGPPCYGSVKICPLDEDEGEGEGEEGAPEARSEHSASLPLLPREEEQHPSFPSSPASSALLLLALSLHSAIEGLAIGLEPSAKGAIFMLIVVSIHKFVIAFCLGMEMALPEIDASGPPPLGKSAAFMGVFSLTSVVGVLGGVIVQYSGGGVAAGETVCAVLQTIAGGALLHVALLEILPRERARCHRIGLAQFAAVSVGFCLSLALEYFAD